MAIAKHSFTPQHIQERKEPILSHETNMWNNSFSFNEFDKNLISFGYRFWSYMCFVSFFLLCWSYWLEKTSTQGILIQEPKNNLVDKYCSVFCLRFGNDKWRLIVVVFLRYFFEITILTYLFMKSHVRESWQIFPYHVYSTKPVYSRLRTHCRINKTLKVYGILNLKVALTSECPKFSIPCFVGEYVDISKVVLGSSIAEFTNLTDRINDQIRKNSGWLRWLSVYIRLRRIPTNIDVFRALTGLWNR